MTQSNEGHEPNKNEEAIAATEAEQATGTAASAAPADENAGTPPVEAADPTEAPDLPVAEEAKGPVEATASDAEVSTEEPVAQEAPDTEAPATPASEEAVPVAQQPASAADAGDEAPQATEASQEAEAPQAVEETQATEAPAAPAASDDAPQADSEEAKPAEDKQAKSAEAEEAKPAEDEQVKSAEGEPAKASEGEEAEPAKAGEAKTDVKAVPHSTGKPAPSPRGPGRPTPRPPKGGRPPMPKKPDSKPAVVPPTPPIDPKAAAEAAAWGRVDEEGNVYLRASGDEGERLVGQYAIGDSKDDALSVYVRRYLDLVAQAALLESRMEIVNPQEINPGLKSLEESLVEPAVVGDVDALRKRTEAIRERLKTRQAEFDEERRVAKIQALAERTAIIERAEAIAAQDPGKTHWRDSRNELTGLLDQWKAAQKAGPRIDRPSEEALWKRFSRARTEFDRHRRQYFSQVEAKRVEVTARKEALIKRAEEMSSSTDWGATSAAYRDLLEEWKSAGRITRKEDDKLWARFRAAQQVFFDARQADRDSINNEQNTNLQAKLELVKEAEAILPIKDIAAAKDKLHDIQDRWEQIGFVPRKDIGRTEGRLRDIESAVRTAEDEQWRKTDPSKTERVSGFAAQLEEAIAKHEAELEEAQAKGDEKAAQRAQEALDARKAWLEQLN